MTNEQLNQLNVAKQLINSVANELDPFFKNELVQAVKSDNYLNIATTGILNIIVFVVSLGVLKVVRGKRNE